MFSAIRAILARALLHQDECSTTFQTTDRIAHCITPDILRLLADTPEGETYRCAIAHWSKFKRPPLAYYQGTSTICQIDGPMQENYLPASAHIKSPGIDAVLTPIEAEDLNSRIKDTIEATIVTWLDANGYDRNLPSTIQRDADHAK